MADVKVDERLWASSMLPEGVVERWFVADGAIVGAGDRIAEVRIEDALHEINAPRRGQVTIAAKVNSVIEPGATLASVAEV